MQNKTLTAMAFVVALVTAWLAQQLVRYLFGYGPGLISALTLLGGFCGGLAAFVAFFRWRQGSTQDGGPKTEKKAETRKQKPEGRKRPR